MPQQSPNVNRVAPWLNLLFASVLAGFFGCDEPSSMDDAAFTIQNKQAGGDVVGRQDSELQKGGPKSRGEPLTAGQPEDWPEFLGPRADGTSTDSIDLSLWTPNPPIHWTIPIGVSYGAPAVVGNCVYQFDRYQDEERLTCFDVSSGKEMWRWDYEVRYSDSFGYNNGPRCSPIVDGENVYVYGVAGQLSCVSTKTKEAVWSKNLNEAYGVVTNFFGVASNPVIYGDLLIAAVGGSPVESQGLTAGRLGDVRPNHSGVVAFNKISGEEVYRVGHALASYSSPTVKQVGGKDIGLALMRGGLLAFEPQSGKQLSWFSWRADMLESVNAASPVVDGNRILISEAYEIGSALLDYRPGEPEVIWKDEKPRYRDSSFRAHWSTPILVDGYLYGGSGRNQPDCDFRCIDFDTGEVKWTFWRHERTSVCFVDGYLIALGELGLIRVLKPSPEKPDVVAECDLGEMTIPGSPADAGRDGRLARPPCWAAPVIAHGKLFIRSDGRLTCFQLSSP